MEGSPEHRGPPTVRLHLGPRWPQLAELPLAVFDISVRRLRRLLRISRYARG